MLLRISCYAGRLMEYNICALGAKFTAVAFMLAPREALQDEIGILHRAFVKRAHSARIKAQEIFGENGNGK